MRKIIISCITTTLLLLMATQPAAAQFDSLMKGLGRAKKVHDAAAQWTPEQEEAIGRSSAAKMIHVFSLYENPEMTRYVALVGNTVAQYGVRDLKYHFAILDTEIINAFALPGGYVFISRGALANIRNESELAGVLSHEVAHVDGRHLEKIIRDKKLTGVAVEEGTSHIPAPSVLAHLADNIITNALTQRYAPDKEREADKNGTDFAAKAGYQPDGLRNFLQMLADAANNTENLRQTGMLNGKTHPPLTERVATLTELVKGYPASGEVLEARYRANANFNKPTGPVTEKNGLSPCLDPKGHVVTPEVKVPAAAPGKKSVSQKSPPKSQ